MGIWLGYRWYFCTVAGSTLLTRMDVIPNSCEKGRIQVVSNVNPIRRIAQAIAGPFCGRLRLNGRGNMLVETMIAVTILGVIGTAVATSLSTARTSGTRVEEAATADNIARNHMASVFAAPYQSPPTTFPALAGLDPGYGSTAVAEVYVVGDTRIEKIIVTVTRDAGEILVLETLRTQE